MFSDSNKGNAELDFLNYGPDPSLEFDLAFHIHSLIWEEPFFARISRYLRKVPDYKIPTAGVCFNKHSINFELHYNPKFFAGLTKEHRKGVLMHEFYHVSLGHCLERKPDPLPGMTEAENHKRVNIAADLAINCLPNMKDKLPDYCLFPGRGSYVDMPELQAMEWYLKKLPKDAGKDGNEGHGDHSGWLDNCDDIDGNGAAEDGEGGKDALREIAAYKLKDIIQKAVNESNSESIQCGQGWGTISQEMRKTIQDRLLHKLDPKKVLSYFVKTSVRSHRKTTVTRINRRWAYIHPGRKWERRPKIAISIDQSGSVSDEMLEKFFSWLNELANYADFTVIPFDDQVFKDKIYVWKKGEHKARERVLCGGTNFNSPTKYVNENDFDGHIICTDMYAEKPINSKCQRMWVTTGYCATHPYFQTSETILKVD